MENNILILKNQIEEEELKINKLIQLMRRELFIKNNLKQWEEIGAGYKEKRKDLNLSTKQVARSIGVSKTTIHNFENGHPITRAKLIEKAYFYFLFYYENNPEKEKQKEYEELIIN